MSTIVRVRAQGPVGLSTYFDFSIIDEIRIATSSENMYTVEIGDLDGDPIELIPATNVQFSFLLNSPGACSFVMDSHDPKCDPELIVPGACSVLIKKNGVLVWAGPVLTHQTSGHQVQFGAEGWMTYFKRRYISKNLVYNDVDQLAIAWDLIYQAQQVPFGNMGISQGDYPLSGHTRDQTYNAVERTVLMDALTSLSQLEDGFDFEITPDKRFIAYYPFKGTQAGVVFELGKNIDGLAWARDATEVYSEVTAIGSGSGDTTLLSVAQDQAALQTYGLLQKSNAYSDVTVQSTLDEHAREDVAVARIVRDDPEIQVRATTTEPPFGSYEVGDNVELVAKDGYIQINKNYRIKTITMALSAEGIENVGVFFDEAVDHGDVTDGSGSTSGGDDGGSSGGHPVAICFIENTDLSEIVGNPDTPWLDAFISGGTLFDGYLGVTHPSLPNYLAVTSGGTDGKSGTDTVSAGEIDRENIYHQLLVIKKNVKAYAEGGGSNFSVDAGSYKLHHNPFWCYKNLEKSSTYKVNCKDLPIDTSGAVDFMTVSPDNGHNAHSGTLAACDSWFSTHIQPLVDAGYFVWIICDEPEGTSSAPILCAVQGPGVAAGVTVHGTYNHYSLNAWVSDHWGVARQQKAISATALPIGH